MAPADLAKYIGKEELSDDFSAVFKAAEDNLRLVGNTPDHLNSESSIKYIQELCDRNGLSMLRINEETSDLYEHWGGDDLFSLNLAKLFHKYRDAQLRNWLLLKSDEINGTQIGLDQDLFLKQFGTPPWELINENLKAFSLPFELTAPYLADFKHSAISFQHSESGEQISFHDLSSGERLLTQFAISSFQFDETFLTIKRPKILLLDEMDASLHPEMTLRWLNAIEEIFVSEQGMHCLVTTHSPTTVALAPEDALYEMRGGVEGLIKISKQDALNKLTFGVPTLSIDYQNRRQVFAESDTDAETYELLYSILKSQIECPFELNFLSTGIRKKNKVETNSGCTIVRKLVDQLVSSGNRTVYGIVDWDGETQSTDRIKVIGEGVRNGIENVLLDPLLICLLLMKHGKAPEIIQDIKRFVGATQLDQEAIQRLVNAVQFCLFPNDSALVEVHYIGGRTASVCADYLSIDDHDLETRLSDTFPFLGKWTKGGHGKLGIAIVREVLLEHTEFCPKEIASVFESLAQPSSL